MFGVMHVVDAEHVKLASYQLKDIANIWYDQCKNNKEEGAPLLAGLCLRMVSWGVSFPES